MSFPLPRRLMLFAVPGVLLAAAGGAAIADTDGTRRPLTPTAQLAQSGGVAAPSPAPVSGGGVSAPPAGSPAPDTVARSVPAAPPAPAPPPDAPPEPEEPASESTPIGDSDEQPPTEPANEPAPEPGPAAGSEPKPAEALSAAEAPLVPAAVLPMEVQEDRAPLIDISPAYVVAEPLQSRADLTAVAAQTEEGEDEDEDEDEVIIPVPPEDFDEGSETPTTREPTARTPEPTAHARGAALPSTGRELAGPALAAMLFLFAGAALRRALASAPTARA